MLKPVVANPLLQKIIFLNLFVLCFMPWISPPMAMLLGLITAQVIGSPFADFNNKAINGLLKISVIGLGFGMNAFSALEAGKNGFFFTITSIAFTFCLGILIGKWFGIDKKITQLISSGTAICGGSAIASVAPIIRASPKQISIAIGIVFLLNSFALFVFPAIGHFFDLSQLQFGIWSAVAIHDTSSVVGAADIYGQEALEVATTVKLARALWILPVSIIFAVFFKGDSAKVKIPYFIGLFVLAMLMNTYIPIVHSLSPYIVIMAKKGLTLSLFLVGTSLTDKTLTSIGLKPFIQGVALWLLISVVSLIVIMNTVN
ncbi:putative sulfate exporter family transporter [Flavobacteriaceae bacterium R38]|nr:putative sulfate exporter family transporter [Flavobacteriaceae bacterium R38]